MTDDELLEIARKHMAEAQDAEIQQREEAKHDLEFLVGTRQWREEDRRVRENDGKPCLTINALPQYVRQVTGQIRSLNPSIKVSPADGDATKEVAEIYQGLIREIEYRCDASSAYEGAAESAAACGIGNWRVRTEYCDDTSFDQHVVIERIFNPFAVFYDPFAKHPTRMDARYAFIIDSMSREQFKADYPDAADDDLTSEHKVFGSQYWGDKDSVVVAEYFWLDHEEAQIVQLPGGQVVNAKDIPPGMMPPGAKKRTVKRPKVMWAKITGQTVLEGPTRVPGRYIPVVAVTGEEWQLGETAFRSGVIRFAKDSQMLYNLSMSSAAEVIYSQPRAPWLVTPNMVAGHEAHWGKANTANLPYLPFNVDEDAPGLIPSRVQPPVPSAGLTQMAQIAAEDMKRTTGIYDASLGARSNETSGRAILARQNEAQNSTSVYADNMVKSVAQTGRIIAEMIPEVYDTQRVVRLLGEDDQEKIEVINAVVMTQNGPAPVNDMKVGKYAVRISVGPSYSTKRQEASEGMMEFLRVVPQAQTVAADLIAGAQDWPDADRMAERLRKILPPGMADEDEEEPTPEQQQAQQMQMMQQQAAMQAEQAAQQIGMRKAEAEAAEAEADATKAQAEAQIKQIELAQMTGQLTQMVDQAVAARLAALMPPPPGPMGLM